MFERGERLYEKYFRRKYSFRFRVDPVPYTACKKCFWGWYKAPKMRKRELALYYEHKKFVRARRNPRYLPDPWDDVLRSDCRTRRCWKNKKIKKQWMKKI